MRGTVVQATLLAGALAATALAGVRWLRVAQREHYLTGSVLRFTRRWWSLGPNRMLGAAALISLVAAAAGIVPAGLVAVAAVAVGPFGLTLRGRTSKLAWTRRLKLLAATSALMVAVLVGLAAVADLAVAAATAVLLAIAAPGVIDAALAVTAPVERRLGRRFVDQATKKLRSIGPTVVAITGSYGKTTTKGYVAHLVAGSRTVVPTPKSYNNQAGLARSINEQLTPGTEVFVAEMGTYGPGEIAAMCAWVVPDIAVITAIGPVHLERMRSEQHIAEAKSEILDGAKVAVLNVDNTLLARLADQAEAAGTRVWRCSAVDRRVDVCAVEDDGTLRVFLRSAGVGGSREIARTGTVAGVGAGSNVACAVAVALEMGVEPEAVAKRLDSLPSPPNRRQVTTGQSGATIIDDTYNSNPAGCAAALALLAGLGGPGEDRRRIVVTPGMVELGDRQAAENTRFAQAAAEVATDIVVVGQTNAAALVAGARLGSARILRVPTREVAVAWVRGQVGTGDVVLYENDLPDHFP